MNKALIVSFVLLAICGCKSAAARKGREFPDEPTITLREYVDYLRGAAVKIPTPEERELEALVERWAALAETKKRAFDPFYTEAGKHDRRKVGLGLPILKQICEACDTVTRSELADAVGGLESVEGLSLAREFLRSQEDALCA